jgi:hypothetical protein
MVLSQKDAVYQAVIANKLPDGSFNRKTVIEALIVMFKAGQFEYGEPEKLRDDKAIRNYCGSILSNWTSRDPRLGGVAAAPNSGSKRKRAKPADDEMKRLMMAKVVLTKEGQSTDEIDALIKQRSQQISIAESAARSDAVADAQQLLDAINQSQ